MNSRNLRYVRFDWQIIQYFAHVFGPAVLMVMPAADGEVAPDIEPLRHRHGRRLVAVHSDGQEVAPFNHLNL